MRARWSMLQIYLSWIFYMISLFGVNTIYAAQQTQHTSPRATVAIGKMAGVAACIECLTACIVP